MTRLPGATTDTRTQPTMPPRQTITCAGCTVLGTVRAHNNARRATPVVTTERFRKATRAPHRIRTPHALCALDPALLHLCTLRTAPCTSARVTANGPGVHPPPRRTWGPCRTGSAARRRTCPPRWRSPAGRSAAAPSPPSCAQCPCRAHSVCVWGGRGGRGGGTRAQGGGGGGPAYRTHARGTNSHAGRGTQPHTAGVHGRSTPPVAAHGRRGGASR
jgi:hypothetical protein